MPVNGFDKPQPKFAAKSETIEASANQHLASEIHDGLCQTLTGISALSAALEKDLSRSGTPDARAAAAEITTLLQTSITEARDLARSSLKERRIKLDIVDSLETLAVETAYRFDVDCTFRCRAPGFDVNGEKGKHLLRVAQEAVNNALTHGRATRIRIMLATHDDTARLSIRDNGIGLRRAPSSSTGIGLQSMAFRAKEIGGSFVLEPIRGRGAAAVCEFPIDLV